MTSDNAPAPWDGKTPRHPAEDAADFWRAEAGRLQTMLDKTRAECAHLEKHFGAQVRKNTELSAEAQHRERAAYAAGWMAAREAAVKAGYDAVNWCRNEAEADLRTVREIVEERILALPPPADAAALAEVVRKARREAFEEAAKIAEERDEVGCPYWADGISIAAAIRARGEGGE